MAMHLQEIETAVREKLPVVYVVLCDRQWGMVKLTQQFGIGELRAAMGIEGEGTINTDFEEVRFHEVAQAMGAHGERVSKAEDLKPALERAVARMDAAPSVGMAGGRLLNRYGGDEPRVGRR